MNEVLQCIHTRRSVRSFEEKPIEEDRLEMILQAGLDAPSAMNTQPWILTAVRRPDMLTGLQTAIAETLHRPDYGRFYNADTLILVSVPDDYPHAIADTACVLENIFLAAHSLGIGSVWINQFKGICGEEAVRRMLTECGIPENHAVWGAAALGYGKPKSKTRENKGKAVILR